MASGASRHLAVALGQRIAAARDAKEMTQRDVAHAIGAHEMRVSNWERGKSAPSAKYEQPLADCLFDGDLNALYGMAEAA